MFCTNCGQQVPDDTRFCPHCGERIATVESAEPRATRAADASPDALSRSVDEVARIVVRIQRGDAAAFTELFERTKGYTAWCIRRQGVPESDVDDILQDVYMTVYNGVDRLRDPKAALAWIKRIAFTRSVNFLTRTHDEVMAEEDTQDWLARNEADAEEQLSRPFDLPEDAVESAEVRKVLRVFIEDLPEDQRRVFVARYLGEVSAADIASAYGMNANTVRSKLMRARRTLQEKVQAYAERTGTNLYSVSALPALWMLFGEEFSSIRVGVTAAELLGLAGGLGAKGATGAAAEALADAAAKSILDGAAGQGLAGAQLTATHVGNVAVDQLTATHVGNIAVEQLTATHVGNIAVGAGTSAGASSGGTTAAGAAAGAAGTAGAAGAAGTAGAAGVATAAAGIGLGAKIAAGVAAIALAGGLGYGVATGAISLPGGGGGQPPAGQSQPAGNATETPEAPAEVSPRDNAYATYSELLDTIENYDFGSTSSTGEPVTYSYAVVEASGDDVPELLVRADSRGGLSSARVFSTTDSGSELVDPLTLLTIGGGNSYWDVYASQSGAGVYQTCVYRGTGIAAGSDNAQTTLYSVVGDELASGESVSFVWDSGAPVEHDMAYVDWRPVDDRSGLEELVDVVPAQDTQTGVEEDIAAAQQAGYDVYMGWIRVLTPEELLEFQGIDRFPNGREEGTYVVLDFGGTMDLEANNGDGVGRRTETCRLIFLACDITDVDYGYDHVRGEVSRWLAYDGQYVAIAVDPDELWFPSDARMPLGEPDCYSATFIGAVPWLEP